ncbi:uncharacterized protein METZ01_LOCUS332993, partial [marine metagenome]
MKMSKEEQKILFNEGFRFIKNNIDKAMISGVIALLIKKELQSFSFKDQIIIDALRRSMNELNYASIEDISEKLS